LQYSATAVAILDETSFLGFVKVMVEEEPEWKGDKWLDDCEDAEPPPEADA
jgi:hypothetical protein